MAELLPASPTFDNADYLFRDVKVVAELKEIQTEFMATEASRNGFKALLGRLSSEEPPMAPGAFRGGGRYPFWFQREFIRLARPPISRVLKKANVQLRETKSHFNIASPTGVMLFVNDGFTGLAPDLVHALACDLLVHSYSSIDCFVYLNVNRYVEVQGSNEPKLLWNPSYSDRAADSLVGFIDALGRQWFYFLEREIGPSLLEAKRKIERACGTLNLLFFRERIVANNTPPSKWYRCGVHSAPIERFLGPDQTPFPLDEHFQGNISMSSRLGKLGVPPLTLLNSLISSLRFDMHSRARE